jgi:hypothetical protein
MNSISVFIINKHKIPGIVMVVTGTQGISGEIPNSRNSMGHIHLIDMRKEN